MARCSSSCMTVAQSLAHVWLFLLLAARANKAETGTAVPSCIADGEASSPDSEVSAIVSLLQAAHSLQTVNSAPEMGLTKYMAGMKHQILALFSVVLPSQETHKSSTISDTTEAVLLPEKSLGDEAMQVRTLWYTVVALLVLAFGVGHWFQKRQQAAAGQGKLEQGATEVPRWFRFCRGAARAKREPCKLMALYEQLDDLDLSDGFPLGYLSRADYQQALSDQQADMVWPRCKCKQCRTWSRWQMAW